MSKGGKNKSNGHWTLKATSGYLDDLVFTAG